MKTSIEGIKGVFPAIFTPYDGNGRLTTKPLRRYLEYLMKAGVDGVFAGGSSGECFLQSVEERSRFAEAVAGELSGEKNIIMHVGSINPRDAYALAKKAKELKVDAISSVVPFYYGYTIKEISAYYKKLIQISELPMIAYYAPENTGLKISNSEFIENIVNLPGVAGVKYTYSDLFQLETLVKGKKDGTLFTYGGMDQMAICFLSMGSQGIIGATFNLIPEIYAELYKVFNAGDIKKAMKLQKMANKFSLEIKKFSRSAYKAILGIRGINTGIPRACWADVTDKDIMLLRKIVEATLKEFKDAKTV